MHVDGGRLSQYAIPRNAGTRKPTCSASGQLHLLQIANASAKNQKNPTATLEKCNFSLAKYDVP